MDISDEVLLFCFEWKWGDMSGHLVGTLRRTIVGEVKSIATEASPRSSIRALLVTSTMLAALGIATPALGQDSLSSAPRKVIDGRGVDVLSGKIETETPGIRIGSEVFQLRRVGLFAFNPLIAYIRFDGTARKVVIEGETKLFNSNGSGGWVPADADGSSLVKVGSSDNFVYTAPNGDKYEFFNQTGPTGNGVPWGTIRSHLGKITRTDGRTITYYYKHGYEQICGRGDCYDRPHVRVQSITTSDGYMLKAAYAGNNPESDFDIFVSVSALDLSIDYCDPIADSCAYSKPWPVVSLSGLDVVDEANATTIVTTTTGGVSSIDLPGTPGSDLSVTYNSASEVSSVTEDGITHSYSYSTSGTTQTVTVTQPDSSTETFVIDTVTKRPTSISDANGKTTTYQYDSSGRLTRETKPEGNYTQLTYDARGNVTERREVAKSGSGIADLVTTMSFPASCTIAVSCNKPDYVIDPRGNRTDYTYSSVHGGVTSVKLPASAVGQPRAEVSYTYSQFYGQRKNSSGTLVSSGIPQWKVTQITTCTTAATCAGTVNERKITIAYANANLLPSSITVANGSGTITQTESYEYDDRDNLIAVDGPLAGSQDKIFYFYGIRSRLEGVIGVDPDDAGAALLPATRYVYDAQDRLLTMERGTVSTPTLTALNSMTVQEQVTNTLDANGRPSKVTVSAGGSTQQVVQYSYNSLGSVECSALRMNPAVFSSLPSSACSAGTTGTAGPDRITKGSYDSAGRLLKVTSGFGSAIAADDQTVTFTNNGQVATVKDSENNLTTFEYDGHDRLVKTRYPSATKGANASSTTDYEQVGYDAGGNVTSFRTRRGETLTMTYDNLGRLVTKVVPERAGLDAAHTRDVFFGYDLAGNMTYARFDSTTGAGVTNTFNAFGQLGSTATNVDGTSRTLSYQYDLAGNLTRLTHPDGAYFTYYRRNSGALDYMGFGSSGAPLFHQALNAQGQVQVQQRWNTTIAAWEGLASYSYDALSRLSGLTLNPAGTTNDTTTSFTYNPAGQIASTTRSNDLYAWAGGVNVNRGYSANGLNQYSAIASTSVTYDTNGNLTGDGTQTYVYDAENRLVSRSGGGTTASLKYDPLGRLYEVTGSATGTTRFLYDGSDLVIQYDGTGAMYGRYVHGLGAGDDALVGFQGSSVADAARFNFLADERGSIVALTDSTGNVVGLNTYDEYGIPGAANIGPFQYTGQVWLPELGMYYYKARMYSPTLGRFMQTDPIGYGDGMNIYAYVGSDPVNKVDPTGLEWDCHPKPGETKCYGGPNDPPPSEINVFAQIRSLMAQAGGSTGAGTLTSTITTRVNKVDSLGTDAQNDHHYDLSVVTQCSADRAFEAVRAAGNSAPGAPYARAGEHDIFLTDFLPWRENPITQTVNVRQRTITNVTGDEHRFHPGTVRITVNDLGGNYSAISIVGTGSGAHPLFNEAVGAAFFGGMAHAVADYCAAASGYPNIKN